MSNLAQEIINILATGIPMAAICSPVVWLCRNVDKEFTDEG